MFDRFQVILLDKCGSDNTNIEVKIGNEKIKLTSSVKLFFNWDSLHARLNSHYKAWSYKKKEHKKIKAYRKSV